MRLIRKKYYQLFNALLFSGLGCFSYLFLINFTNLSEKGHEKLYTFWAFFAVIFIFNVLGYTLIQINSWVDKRAPFFFVERMRFVWHYVFIALLLLLLNYALFVFVKLLVDLPRVFYMNVGITRILFTIWLVELVIVGLVLINNSFHYMLKLYREKLELQESSTKAQYMALQSQLNPHFLFNSLNALISEIEYNPQNAVEFTRNLSDVYRYILQCQDQTLVSLRSELEFLNSYVFLHQVRLGDCICVENSIASSLLDRKVPPLTLQLLAENVIKHNSMSLSKPMTIGLAYSEVDDMLVVSNELRPKQGVVKLGKGLHNLVGRYRLICGKEVVVEETSTHFIVKTPLLYE